MDELFEALLEELKITFSTFTRKWNWETEEYCSDDEFSTPNDAYDHFVNFYSTGGFN